MWVGICKQLLTVITVAHNCVRVITKYWYHCQCPCRVVSCRVFFTEETVLGLQQIELPSHLTLVQSLTAVAGNSVFFQQSIGGAT